MCANSVLRSETTYDANIISMVAPMYTRPTYIDPFKKFLE